MSTSNALLPVTNESFRHDAVELLSLSIDQLGKLFRGLEERRSQFSSAYVGNILGKTILESRNIRLSFLALNRYIYSNRDHAKQIQDELVGIGCKSEKVEHFVRLGSTLAPSATAACELLLEVQGQTYANEHLKRASFTFSYITAEHAKEKSPLTYPMVLVSMVTHTSEEDRYEKIGLYIDGNEFETVVLSFKEALDRLREQSKALKASLGQNYVDLIGE